MGRPPKSWQGTITKLVLIKHMLRIQILSQPKPDLFSKRQPSLTDPLELQLHSSISKVIVHQAEVQQESCCCFFRPLTCLSISVSSCSMLAPALLSNSGLWLPALQTTVHVVVWPASDVVHVPATAGHCQAGRCPQEETGRDVPAGCVRGRHQCSGSCQRWHHRHVLCQQFPRDQARHEHASECLGAFQVFAVSIFLVKIPDCCRQRPSLLHSRFRRLLRCTTLTVLKSPVAF